MVFFWCECSFREQCMMLIYTEIIISIEFNQFHLAKELKFTIFKSPNSLVVHKPLWHTVTERSVSFSIFAITQGSSRNTVIQLIWMYCQSVTVCQDVTSGAKSNTFLYRQRKRSYRKQVICNIPPKILSFLQQSHVHQFSRSSARLNDLFIFIFHSS